MENQTRLLLFDLDDTLLNSQKYISHANVDAISKCKSKGMIIGYITARAPRKVKTYLKDLPCDCIAYYNGASIFAENIMLEKNEIFYSEGIRVMTEIQNAYPSVQISAHLEPYNYFDGQIRNIITNEIYPGTIQDLPLYNFQRIRIVMENLKDASLDRFITYNMNYILSVNGTAIITSKKASKEIALCRFAEYFNIQLSNVIAFGDDTNDIDMIKTAGIGIAMGNAINDVKSAADYICDTNDNDGVSKWINSFLL